MSVTSSPSKVALITGSGKRRVGNATAHALAERGYAIALHYNRSADDAQETVGQLERQGIAARAFQADVADEPQVDRLFREVLDHFGRLDALVTAAAVWIPTPLEETTAADVRRQFDVNTLGTFLCCRRAGLIMAGQPEGGAIVTIGDWAVKRPYPGYAAYFVSKGAIPTLTRMLAVELSQRNPHVRVNCILPGPVMLPENLSQPEVQGAVAGTLLKRPGRPENVAQAVVFLVENDYVTGVCLPVDGGRTIA
jgi:pteridine reductase